MANQYDVGSIVAGISVDTRDLVKSFAEIDKQLNKLNSSFASMEKSITKSMSTASKDVSKSFKEITAAINKSGTQMATEVGYASNRVVAALANMNRAAKANTKEMGASFDTLNTSISKRLVAVNRTLTASLTSFRAYSKNSAKAFSDLSTGIANNTTQITNSITFLNAALNTNLAQGFNNLSRQMALQTQILSNTFNNLGITMQNSLSGIGSSIRQNNANTSTWNSTIGGMFPQLQSIFGVFSRISFQIFIIRQGLQQAADLLAPFIESGLKLAEKIEVVRLGYAGLLASTALENGQEIPFNRALELSDQLLKQIQIEAVRTALSFEELADAVQTALAPGVSQGWSLDQIVKLTSTATLAVKSMGLAKGQVIQEVRALVSGKDIRPATDTLARNLGYTTAIIKKLREEGKLYDDIMERMKGFSVASEDFATTLRGIMEGISDGIAMVQKEALGGLFEELKSGLSKIRDVFYEIKKETVELDDGTLQEVVNVKFRPEMLDFFRELYSVLGDVARIIIELSKVMLPIIPVLQVVWTVFKLVLESVKYLTVAFYPIIEAITMFSVAIMKALKEMDKLMFSTGTYNETLKIILVTLAAIKIAFLVFSAPVLAILALITLVAAIGVAMMDVRDSTTSLGKYFDSFIISAKAGWNSLVEVILAVKEAMMFNPQAAKQHRENAAAYEKIMNEESANRGSFLTAFGESIGNIYDRAKNAVYGSGITSETNPTKPAEALSPKHDTEGKGDTDKRDRSAEREQKRQFKLIDSQIKQGQQLIKNAISALERKYAEYGVSIYDFYNDKLRLEKNSLDIEIAGLEKKMDLATESTEKERLAEQIQTTRAKKIELEIDAQKKLFEEYQKFQELLKNLNSAFQDISGNTLEESRLEILDKYGANYMKIVRELVTAEQELENIAKGTAQAAKWQNLIDKSKIAMQQLEKIVKIQQAQALIEAQELRVKQTGYSIDNQIKSMEQDVSNIKNTSWKVEEKAHRLRQRANKDYLDAYGKLIAYYEIESKNTTYSITKQIELKQKAEETRLALRGILEDMNPIEKAARQTFQSGLSDALDSILWKTKSASEAFKDLGKSLLQTLSKMAFESISASITEAIFGGLFKKKIKSDTEIEVKVDKFKSVINTELANTFSKFETSVMNLDFMLSEKLVPALTQASSIAMNGVGINPLGLSTGNEKDEEKEKGDSFGYEEGTGSSNFTFQSNYADLFATAMEETTGNIKLLGDNFTNLLPTLKELANSQQDLTSKNQETSMMAIPNLLTSLAMVSGNEGLMKFAAGLQLVMQVMQMFSQESGGGGGGGLFGSLFKGITGMFGAGAGGKAAGGFIQGAGTSTSDSIPSMLSNGEFVVRAAAVKKYGLGVLNGINRGVLPNNKFAEGGLVGKAKLEEAGQEKEASPSAEQKVSPAIIMNNTFQSLDPKQGMDMFKTQMPMIKAEMINAIRSDSSMRGAIKGVR